MAGNVLKDTILLCWASNAPQLGQRFYRLWRLPWLVLLVGLFTIGAGNTAHAHATVIRSEPADTAVYAVPPDIARLWFSEPVSQRFSSARLLDSEGQIVALMPIQDDKSDGNGLAFSLPPLTPGAYTLLWRALSEADGHFSQGIVVFGVGEQADLSAAPSSTTITTMPPTVELVLRWLNFGLLTSVVGALAVALLIMPAAQIATNTAINRAAWAVAEQQLRQWVAWSIGGSLLVGLGLLLWQSSTLLGGTGMLNALAEASWLVLSQTRWGQLWLARQVILLLLWLLVRQSSLAQRGWRVPALLLLSLALLTVQAWSGHAAGDQEQRTLTVVIAVLHTLAASLWLGGLTALLITLWPLRREDSAQAGILAQACWRAFSLPALGSVGLLLATGLYHLGRQVASLDALITTAYGRVLLAKVGLVLIMGLLGLLNTQQVNAAFFATTLLRLQYTSARLTRTPTGLPRFLTPEVTAGLLVLLCTAFLTATPPPRGLEFTLDPAAIPLSLSQSVDDLVVTMAVKPNRPGQNTFAVRSVSTHRPAPAPIIRLLLRFTHLEQDLAPLTATAQEVEPGHYLVTGPYLKIAGPWQIDVVTRRSGLPDQIARFTWIVAPPGALRPIILSKQPWASTLTLAAAGMLLVTLLIVMVGQWQMSRK